MAPEETFDRLSHAVVCRPGDHFSENDTPAVGIPDQKRALLQHQKYREALEKCGVTVVTLSPEPLFPNGFSVSDLAVVAGPLAVIGNFSENNARQGEQKNVAAALAGDRFLKFITAPGQLGCGDVLQAGNHFYISLSGRTNQEGAAQLAFFLKEYGFQVTVLDLTETSALRLGTAAVYLGKNRLLIREELVRHFSFLGYDKITVLYNERGAAGARMVNGTLIMPAGYAETAAKVKALGLPVLEVNISEFEKMGAGIASLSLCLPALEKSNVVSLQHAQKSAA